MKHSVVSKMLLKECTVCHILNIIYQLAVKNGCDCVKKILKRLFLNSKRKKLLKEDYHDGDTLSTL